MKLTEVFPNEIFWLMITVKKVFFKISQNWQESICTGVSFLISCRLPACIFTKTRLRYRCFPEKFGKNFGNAYFIEHLRTAASVCYLEWSIKVKCQKMRDSFILKASKLGSWFKWIKYEIQQITEVYLIYLHWSTKALNKKAMCWCFAMF